MTIGEERPLVTSDFYTQAEDKLKIKNCHEMIAQQRLPIHMAYLQPHLTVRYTLFFFFLVFFLYVYFFGKRKHEKQNISSLASTQS